MRAALEWHFPNMLCLVNWLALTNLMDTLCYIFTAYLMLHLSKKAHYKFVMYLFQHVCAVKLGPGHPSNSAV